MASVVIVTLVEITSRQKIHTIHIGHTPPWILDEAGEPLDVRLTKGILPETIHEATETADAIAMPKDGGHGLSMQL